LWEKNVVSLSGGRGRTAGNFQGAKIGGKYKEEKKQKRIEGISLHREGPESGCWKWGAEVQGGITVRLRFLDLRKAGRKKSGNMRRNEEKP